MKKTTILLSLVTLMLIAGCNKAASKTENTCDKACENYALCASYGDDVTPADVDDAYATCMEECAKWESENISCMAKATVHNPQDCLAVTMCGLNQYQGLIDGTELPE